MTVVITVRDQLESVEVEGSFNDIQTALNIGASKGWSFITFTREDNGQRIAFQVGNINTMEETDETMGSLT